VLMQTLGLGLDTNGLINITEFRVKSKSVTRTLPHCWKEFPQSFWKISVQI